MHRFGNLHGDDERGKICDGDIYEKIPTGRDKERDGQRNGNEQPGGDRLRNGVFERLRQRNNRDADGSAEPDIDFWRLGWGL